MTLPFPFSMIGAGGAALGYSNFGYRGSVEDSSLISSYSFAAVDIGTPDVNRYVIVGVLVSDQTGSSVVDNQIEDGTDDPIDFTLLVQVGVTSYAAIHIASVPSGSTMPIHVVLPDTSTKGCAIVVWTVQMSSPITHDTSTGTVSTGTTLNLATSVIPADGFGVVIANNPSSRTATINQSFTERVDDATSFLNYYGADRAAAMTSATVTLTFNGSLSATSGVFASWNGLGT